jgi:hypothetical protein
MREKMEDGVAELGEDSVIKGSYMLSNNIILSKINC